MCNDVKCAQCGRAVEEARRVYVIPTCYSCLPPPPPLELEVDCDDSCDHENGRCAQ